MNKSPEANGWKMKLIVGLATAGIIGLSVTSITNTVAIAGIKEHMAIMPKETSWLKERIDKLEEKLDENTKAVNQLIFILSK